MPRHYFRHFAKQRRAVRRAKSADAVICYAISVAADDLLCRRRHALLADAAALLPRYDAPFAREPVKRCFDAPVFTSAIRLRYSLLRCCLIFTLRCRRLSIYGVILLPPERASRRYARLPPPMLRCRAALMPPILRRWRQQFISPATPPFAEDGVRYMPESDDTLPCCRGYATLFSSRRA